jgi:hypothetical protein
MTQYRDWLRDFPNRCIEVLELLEDDARMHGREVTLLLSVGSILLNVPMERLKERQDKWHKPIVHPVSQREPKNEVRMANEELARKFNLILQEIFMESQTLWGNNAPGKAPKRKWWGKNVEDDEYKPAEPDEWLVMSGEEECQLDKWPVGMVLNTIRNACAHAHVLTYDSTMVGERVTEKDKGYIIQISRLVFVSVRNRLDEQPTKFRYVSTTPEAFKELLINWAKMIPCIDPLGAPAADDSPHL